MIYRAHKLGGDRVSLLEIIRDIDIYPPDFSFGDDIDAAHRMMFDQSSTEEGCSDILLDWLARYQPCLFGRLGARFLKGVGYDICWLTTTDISRGDQLLSDKIQDARRRWKDRAAKGIVSGFLIMLKDERLARAKPGPLLLSACRHIAELYLVESAPLDLDTIYTEAIPLCGGEGFGGGKAGVNMFYPGAHRTLNHDRRIPGGVLLSVNSPGHLANALVMHGRMKSLAEAVRWIYGIAMNSIGNGGIGHEGIASRSWYNLESFLGASSKSCPIGAGTKHVSEVYSRRIYSANYHTDVLLPSEVTVDFRLDLNRSEGEIWPWLVIDYISETKFPVDHVNYGLFHAHRISPEARYHNPWPPRLARNEPLFKY